MAYRLPFTGGDRAYTKDKAFISWPMTGAPGCADHIGPVSGAIDYQLAKNTPVYATERGKVVYADWWKSDHTQSPAGSYGQIVQIQHPNGSISYYAHLNSFAVKNDDKVSRGQLIGLSGNTGNVDPPLPNKGYHLHFEIRQDDTTNPFVLRDPSNEYSGYLGGTGIDITHLSETRWNPNNPGACIKDKKKAYGYAMGVP